MIRHARPQRKNVKCVCFIASTALLGLMLALGLPVRTHPLHPDRYVVPLKSLSESQLRELVQRHDFIFLATVVFLVSPTGSLQTYTSDATWNNASNTIECVGDGGSGGAGNNANGNGAGGGAYALIANFSFATPGTTTAQYEIGPGGAAVTAVGYSGIQNGNSGSGTWFNGTTLAGSSVGADFGLFGAGNYYANGPGAGGLAANSIGSTKYSGGSGGGNPLGENYGSDGGGGAAGLNGAGNNGVAESNNTSGTNGGSGDAGSGGAGGTGSASWTGTPSNATAGGNGTEYGTRGSGGGGGSGMSFDGITPYFGTGAAGGLYGGGGGGGSISGASSSSNNVTSGAGAQGLIVLTWTPAGGGAVDTLGQTILRVRSPGWRW
jgi:hypothetical protein